MQYSRETLHCPIDEHSVGRRLPRPSDGISIFSDVHIFKAFQAADSAQSIDDYLYEDRPQLGLHVVSFTNATLVTLTWPHTSMDGLGRAVLVENWCRVLAGRDAEVPPLAGVYDDPLAKVVDGPVTGPHVLHDQILGVVGLLVWIVRRLLEVLWVGGRHEERFMCIPAAQAARLREEAVASLSTLGLGGDGGGSKPPPFISESDVLSAWLLRLVCLSSLGRDSTRPVSLSTVVSLRHRLTGGVFDASAAYVNNLVSGATTNLVCRDAVRMPMGQLALRLRASLTEQATEDQLRTAIRLTRAHLVSGRVWPALYMKPSSVMVQMTNLARARLLEIVDFGPAVVSMGAVSSPLVPGSACPAPGKPVYGHSMETKIDAMLMQFFVGISGKDHEGTYWLRIFLPPSAWPKVEEEIDRMEGKG